MSLILQGKGCCVHTNKVLVLYYYIAIRTVIIYVDRTQIHDLPWMWRWEVWGGGNLNLFPLNTFSCVWGGCLYVESRNGFSFKFGSLSRFCYLSYPLVMLVRNADSEPHPHPQIRTCLYQGPQGIWAPYSLRNTEWGQFYVFLKPCFRVSLNPMGTVFKSNELQQALELLWTGSSYRSLPTASPAVWHLSDAFLESPLKMRPLVSWRVFGHAIESLLFSKESVESGAEWMEGESPGVWAPSVAGAPAGVKGNSFCRNEIAVWCTLVHLFGKHCL